MKQIILWMVDFYIYILSFDRGLLRILAPGGACWQTPSCSLYTRQMIKQYGTVRGLVLGGRRILACR